MKELHTEDTEELGNATERCEGSFYEGLPKRTWLAHALGVFLMLSSPNNIVAGDTTPVSKSEITTTHNSEVQDLLEKRRKIYGIMKEVVESQKLKEKLSIIKKKFGGAVSSFINSNRIDEELELVEQIDPSADKDLVDYYEWKGRPMFTVTKGSTLESGYEDRWVPHNGKFADVTVKGVDNVGTTTDTLRRAMDDRYGKGYVSSSVASIDCNPETKAGAPGTIILGDSVSWSIFRTSKSDDRRAEVNINKGQDDFSENYFWSVFDHELQHANDWNSNPNLTTPERIEFLYEVMLAEAHSGRYRTKYLDYLKALDSGRLEAELKVRSNGGLPPGTTPKQVQDYIMAVEYWAEVSAKYLSGKDELEKEYPADFKLAEKWIKKIKDHINP